MALAVQNGKHPTGGSAVAINPYTGAIYALASVPTFNQVQAANDPAYLASLLRPTSPTLNRAISGVYPTGSTFKPIIAEAALSAGIITLTTHAALQRLVQPRQLRLPQRRGAASTRR